MKGRAERGPRGFVSRVMANPIALALAGGGVLLAVLIGVNLGNATVEGIDPSYFRAPETPRLRQVVLDEVPAAPLSRRLPSYHELYGWDEGAAALAADCGANCGVNGDYSAAVPYFGSREELAAAHRDALREIDRDYAREAAAATRPKAPAGPATLSPSQAAEAPEENGL